MENSLDSDQLPDQDPNCFQNRKNPGSSMTWLNSMIITLNKYFLIYFNSKVTYLIFTDSQIVCGQCLPNNSIETEYVCEMSRHEL